MMRSQATTNTGGAAYVVLLLAGIWLVLVAIALIYGTWAWSVVYGWIWDWYAHPIFPALRRPTAAQFVALSIVVGLFRSGLKSSHDADSDDTVKKWSAFAIGILHPWIFAAGAWFVQAIWTPGPWTP